MTAAEPEPLSRGLWGRDGLAAAPSKSKIVFLIVATTLLYGFSLLVNGAAGSIFPPRFALAPLAPGADPLGDPLRVVVRVLDPMFLLCAFRFIACGLLVAALTRAGDTPWQTGVGEPGAHAVGAGAMALTRRAGIPVLVGACNAGGYLFYMALTARGGVAIWSALVGLYIVIPVGYGIVVKGEARTRRKLLGVAVCTVASILLGYGEEQRDASNVPWYSNALLFIVCVSLWGVCDGLSAFMGRELHLWWVAGLTGLGFGLVALLCALLSFFVTGSVAAGAVSAAAAAAAPAGGISVGWGYTLMAVAQAAGVTAWFISVKIGVLSEASAFLPIVSLYTSGASLLAVPILGETLPPAYWPGLLLGIAGILLIAYSGEAAAKAGALRDEEAEAGPPALREDILASASTPRPLAS